jgi:hypothetical protein
MTSTSTEHGMPATVHPTSAAPGTTTVAVTSWPSPAVDHSSRVLRKGDLVRVAERYARENANATCLVESVQDLTHLSLHYVKARDRNKAS